MKAALELINKIKRGILCDCDVFIGSDDLGLIIEVYSINSGIKYTHSMVITRFNIANVRDDELFSDLRIKSLCNQFNKGYEHAKQNSK